MSDSAQGLQIDCLTSPDSALTQEIAMRALFVIGALLVILGICALMFQGVTYFTTERVGQAGPFAIDVQKPHTIIFHPVLGIAALIGGIVCIAVGSQKRVRA
jgi:hypothetical protein